MFESAELGHCIDKEVWKKEVPALREALLDAQYDLVAAKKFPVIILIAGVDGSGKSGPPTVVVHFASFSSVVFFGNVSVDGCSAEA